MKHALAIALAASALGCRGAAAPASSTGTIDLSISALYVGSWNPPGAGYCGLPCEGSGAASISACADVTLLPYRLDQAGHRTFAGAASRFSLSYTGSSSAGVPKPFAAACTDEGELDGGPGASSNWGYIVSARNFTDCSGNPIPGTIEAAVADAPAGCVAGATTSLPVTLQLGLAAGTVETGSGIGTLACKQADFDSSDSLVHFGQDALVAPDGGAPTWGFAAVSSAPEQLFSGTLPDSSEAVVYLTGLADPSTSAIFTSFGNTCASGGEFVDSSHFGCLTTSTPSAQTPLATSARIDAFIATASGFASAQLVSTSGTSNAVSVVSSAQAIAPVTFPLGGSTSADGAPTTGLTVQEVAAPGLTGVFVDRTTPGQFLVTTDPASGSDVPQYATLSQSNGTWQLGALLPLPDPAQAACIGLFSSTTGCLGPANCTPAP